MSAVEKWKELSLGLKSEGTAREYMKCLKKFLEVRGVTAEEAASWDAQKAEEELRRFLSQQKQNGVIEDSRARGYLTEHRERKEGP